MSGDADEAHEPLVARRGQRLDRAAGTERDVPLVGLDEVVQLDQIDLVDAHPVERSFELGPCGVALAFAGLGGEEHVAAVVGEPWPEPHLGFAVAGRGVDVVDAARAIDGSVASARSWVIDPSAAAPKIRRVD